MTNRRFAIIAIVLMTMGQSLAGQATKQTRWDYLQTKNRRFIDYQNDFKTLMQSAQECREIISIADLYERAETAAYSCLAARTLLYIYDEAQCQKTERAIMWPLIKGDLEWYAGHLDNAINAVNSDLVSAKNPAVAASGTRMKDDLRELKTFFESVRPN